MHIVVAPDSYKGCLEASQVASTIKDAWQTVFPEATVEMVPLADGGEGTMDALLYTSQGKKWKLLQQAHLCNRSSLTMECWETKRQRS